MYICLFNYIVREKLAHVCPVKALLTKKYLKMAHKKGCAKKNTPIALLNGIIV